MHPAMELAVHQHLTVHIDAEELSLREDGGSTAGIWHGICFYWVGK